MKSPGIAAATVSVRLSRVACQAGVVAVGLGRRDEDSGWYRLVVAGIKTRVSYPGSNFKEKLLIGQLELSELKMFALVLSPRELSKSLALTSIRPLEQKLL